MSGKSRYRERRNNRVYQTPRAVIERAKKLLLGVRIMRITSKGQVTIPIAIREKAGLLPNTEVEFELDGKIVRLRRASGKTGTGRGARFIARMRGRGDVTMATDQIMALTRGK
jgi:AbrB family looped-hinge helix DNA binding protein